MPFVSWLIANSCFKLSQRLTNNSQAVKAIENAKQYWKLEKLSVLIIKWPILTTQVYSVAKTNTKTKVSLLWIKPVESRSGNDEVVRPFPKPVLSKYITFLEKEVTIPGSRPTLHSQNIPLSRNGPHYWRSHVFVTEEMLKNIMTGSTIGSYVNQWNFGFEILKYQLTADYLVNLRDLEK